MFKNMWLSPEGAAGSGGQSNAGTQQAAGTQQGAGSQQAAGSGQPGTGNEQALKYEDWVKDQPKNVQTMLGGWEHGLKTALTSEREIRSETEKQLRELAKKAEKGSEAETKLTGMADQIAESDRRSDFYEEAHKAGITNLKLSFLVATQDKLFDSKGRVNFEAMKKDYPELFGGTKIPDGDAGSGTDGGGAGGSKDMNKLIRKAAGRST